MNCGSHPERQLNSLVLLQQPVRLEWLGMRDLSARILRAGSQEMTANDRGSLTLVKEEKKTFSIHHNPGCFICRLVFTTSPTQRMPLETGQHCGLVYGYSYLPSPCWPSPLVRLHRPLVAVNQGDTRAISCCPMLWEQSRAAIVVWSTRLLVPTGHARTTSTLSHESI